MVAHGAEVFRVVEDPESQCTHKICEENRWLPEEEQYAENKDQASQNQFYVRRPGKRVQYACIPEVECESGYRYKNAGDEPRNRFDMFEVKICLPRNEPASVRRRIQLYYRGYDTQEYPEESKSEFQPAWVFSWDKKIQ